LTISGQSGVHQYKSHDNRYLKPVGGGQLTLAYSGHGKRLLHLNTQFCQAFPFKLSPNEICKGNSLYRYKEIMDSQNEKMVALSLVKPPSFINMHAGK
jgi:hypothetical protein